MIRPISIYRYDPETDSEGTFKSYDVNTDPGMSVMDILDFIHFNIDPSLSYYSHSACLHGICNRCFVRVNGKNVLACETLVPRNGDIIIEPTSRERVLKDLVTRQRNSKTTQEENTNVEIIN